MSSIDRDLDDLTPFSDKSKNEYWARYHTLKESTTVPLNPPLKLTVNRRGQYAVKHEFCPNDCIPMWVADMDLPVAPVIQVIIYIYIYIYISITLSFSQLNLSISISLSLYCFSMTVVFFRMKN